jgi:hypothetical protein
MQKDDVTGAIWRSQPQRELFCAERPMSIDVLHAWSTKRQESIARHEILFACGSQGI